MREPKFLTCKRCGLVLEVLQEAGEPVTCCGEKMEPLLPNTVEASGEKHIPVVAREGDEVRVTVGSAAHPMTEEHSIQWVLLQTEGGEQRKDLRPGVEPAVTFSLAGDRPLAAYGYCNLHGLWKTEL